MPGKSGVDGGLSFFRVDAEYCKGGLTHSQDASGVDRTAGMLEVGTAAEGVQLTSGMFALQHPLKDLAVAGADGAERSGTALIAVGANLQNGGL
jgi:hypothetical protein